MVMGMKTNVILVENSLGYLDGHACPISIISFLHKIYSNALPLGDVVLGGVMVLFLINLFI